jgi:hypothetical protein
MVATNLSSIAARYNVNISIRSQRDLQPRDFDDGNYILLGGPSSNLWDTLFQDQLNFTLTDNLPGGEGQFSFKNRNPKPGEPKQYGNVLSSGSSNDEYGAIAFLPATQGHGRILILQGLRQEGTEAAGQFLTSTADQELLKKALGVSGDSCPTGFEVLIRTRIIGGDPKSTEIVASRLQH